VSAGPFAVITSGDVRMGGLKHAPSGRFEIEIDVQAPSWIPTDRIRLYVDGQPRHEIPLSSEGVQRYRGRLDVECKSDCFVVAWVEGDESLAPLLPSWRSRDPRPVALTNPIFADVDGDGRYGRSETP
jgi:hypothetical protein